jgi:AcrR family transcriptional regulator
VAEAARLVALDGPGVTTRAICEAAGVTAPTLYHYFGDRDGLLAAVVTEGFTRYLARKREVDDTGDPLADLRRGWDDHIDWGLANPNFYVLMYGRVTPGLQHPAATEATDMLAEKLSAAARAGMLRVPVETGVRMIMAANTGLTLQLIATGAPADISTAVRDSIFATVLQTDAVAESPTQAAAITLRASLAAESPLPPAETALLSSWLELFDGR